MHEQGMVCCVGVSELTHFANVDEDFECPYYLFK